MSEQYPRPGYAWYVVGIMLLAMIVSLTDRMVISLLVVPIQQDIGLSDADMGWILGVAFGLFYSIMGLPLGRMVDRFNRPRLIATGIVLWSLMTVASGFADTFWELFLARTGVGIGEAVLAPAAWSLISDMFPPTSRARALSVFQLGGICGVSLGYLLGGAVFQIAGSPDAFAETWFDGMSPWRIVFLLAGVPGLLLTVAVFLIREPRANAQHTALPMAEVWGFLRGSGRTLLPLFLGLAGIMLAVHSVNSWAPALLGRKFGLGSDEIGRYLGLAALIGGVPGTFLGGWLTDRAVRAGRDGIYIQILIAGALGVIPTMFLISQLDHAGASIALIGVFFFVALFPNGVMVAYTQRVTPQNMRGIIGATQILVANLIGYMGPTAIGLVSDHLLGGKQHIGESLTLVGVAVGLTSLALFAANRKSALAMVNRVEMAH